MKKLLSFILIAMVVSVWVACNDDKKQINEYLEKNYSDREVKVVGKVEPDSVFFPLSKLESTKIEIMGYRVQLLMLLDQDPDSAYRLAQYIKQKYIDEKTIVDLINPKGKNDRIAYNVQCTEDGEERYIIFYKNVKDETIQFSSFEVNDMVDSLSKYYALLVNGVNEIVNDYAGYEKKEKSEERSKEGNKKDE